MGRSAGLICTGILLPTLSKTIAAGHVCLDHVASIEWRPILLKNIVSNSKRSDTASIHHDGVNCGRTRMCSRKEKEVKFLSAISCHQWFQSLRCTETGRVQQS
jgi:hypothetical protein